MFHLLLLGEFSVHKVSDIDSQPAAASHKPFKDISLDIRSSNVADKSEAKQARYYIIFGSQITVQYIC